MKNFKLVLLLIITLVMNGCKKTITENSITGGAISSTTISTGATGIFEITKSDLVSTTSKLPAG